INAFIRMRKRVNPLYHPQENFKNTIYSQTLNDSVRIAGWDAERDRTESFERHWKVAKIISGYGNLKAAA
ncbi:hypothetical protein KY343_02330, partial [Candidatus Woesearchaeota archaeon]|nr:hypothetical protein [Candidatus Woesearchaeota archaeon]